MSQSETFTIEVPLSEIADADMVAASFAEIQREFSDKPDERTIALRGLIDSITLRDGSDLATHILEQVTHMHDDADAKRERIAAGDKSVGAIFRRNVLNALAEQGDTRAKESALVVQVDENSADVVGVFQKEIMPGETERQIEAKRRAQARIPSGPTQNSLSGGTSTIDPNVRR